MAEHLSSVSPVAPNERSPHSPRIWVGRAGWTGILTAVLLVGLAALVGAAAVLLAGGSPLIALGELVQGAVGTRTNVAATVTRSLPIITCGLAAAVAFKAGQFNLGIEGQMVIGALATAAIANGLRDLPPVLLLPLALGGGMVAGGLWAWPAAWWQTRLNVPLLITTLLLNYVAINLASYLVNFPLRDTAGGTSVAQTVMIPESIRFPVLVAGTRLHGGIVPVVLAILAVVILFRTTAPGYRWRMVGLNPEFARYAGLPVSRAVGWAMFTSGALAGIAGAVQVLGVDFRFIDNALVAPGFAWTGFIAAILAAANPVGVVAAGLFLSGLDVGAAGMQRNTGLPLQIADLVQAGIIFIAAIRLRVGAWVRRLLVRPTIPPNAITPGTGSA